VENRGPSRAVSSDNLDMLLYKIGLVIGVVLILVGTAFISTSNTDPHVAYTFIALLAFGLELADGSTMGFVFILLALPHLNWMETMLMAGSAQMILITARRERPDPRKLLITLMANSAAVLTTQLFFHSPVIARVDQPVRMMLSSGPCFLTLRFLDVIKRDKWSFLYYPVASALGVLFPIAASLPPLVYLTWRSCRLYERRLKAQRETSRAVASLHLRTIETLALAIEARDQPASIKPRRVQVYCVEMAKELGLKEQDVEAIRAASLLYDIGEMAVPENIILKPGPLTDDEYEKIKIHPVVGADILERVKFPYPVAPIVLAHHERWDGAGYPNGLSGETIPLGARLLAVADAFDALISARHHRSAVSVDDALKHLEAESGRAFDPKIVSLLRSRHKQWEKQTSSTSDRGFIDSILCAQREVKVMMELTEKLGSSLDVNETFASLKPAIRSLTAFDTLAIWVEREGSLTTEFVSGDHLSLLSTLRLPIGGGVSGLVAANQSGVLNGNAVSEFARFPMEYRNPFKYVLSAPLHSGGLRGAISLYRSKDEKFTAEDSRVLTALAPRIAMAAANGLAFRETSNEAATDPLTGLPNASALFRRMEASLPPVILICDLDGFKAVNDQFGHITGNRLLKGLAIGFRKSCRSGDFVARMGGDEFVLLLNEMRPEEVGARLIQFRDMVKAVGREVCGADVMDASFGVAFYPKDGTTPNELLAFADQQMYRRKSEQKAGVLRIERTA
jgi:diguanylate cyclase (GGDEF)-like protein/putative nucleotidyltransferase with HDIG domain